MKTKKKLMSAVMGLALLGATSALADEAVNINTADAQTLAATIKGVGEKRAEAIIAYREQHGPFNSVEDLAQVRGVSTQMIENSREKLAIGSGND